MRWLASRFLDVDLQEELGILTKEVRARKAAQDAVSSQLGDSAGPAAAGDGTSHSHSHSHGQPSGSAGGAGGAVPASEALTDTPPVMPAVRQGLDLGPACQQCGGMMQRTGSCYTCGSCGFNTGCG